MKEGVYEFGDARAVVKQRIGFDQFNLWLLYKDHVVTMDDGAMILEKLEQGVELDTNDAFMSWDGTQEITMSIFEIFNVLNIASGGPRSADEAYERGKLEGENKILKEWNQSLTEVTTPSHTQRDDRPSSPTVGDQYSWNKYPLTWDGTYGTISGTSSGKTAAARNQITSMLDEINGVTDGVEPSATPKSLLKNITGS